MAIEFTVSIPDAQLDDFESYINPAGGNDTEEKKKTAVKEWIQEWVNQGLWTSAHNKAKASVSDPTV
jgi:hypothetical protein|tara:strand:+ start:609 stop:809 length:201 start_codon:yes stop_codon:yes gene_type:complete